MSIKSEIKKVSLGTALTIGLGILLGSVIKGFVANKFPAQA